MCKVIRTARWYYRCLDCLNVAAANSRHTAIVCGACGGKCEMMGQVIGQRLADVSHQCACDGRCTGATGPSCDCSCGGENHGSGKVVRVVTDLGPIPMLSIADDGALLRATEFRAAMAVLDAYMRSPRAPHYCYAYRTIHAAKAAKTHAGRMAKLNSCIERIGRMPAVA